MRGISANQIDLTCFTCLREVLVLRCFPRIPVVTPSLPPSLHPHPPPWWVDVGFSVTKLC